MGGEEEATLGVVALSSRLVMRCLSESGVCVTVYTNMKGSFEVVQYTYVLEAEYTEIGYRMAPHTQPHQTPVRPQVFSQGDLPNGNGYRTKTSDLSLWPGHQLKSEVLDLVVYPLPLRRNIEFTPDEPKSSDTLYRPSTPGCALPPTVRGPLGIAHNVAKGLAQRDTDRSPDRPNLSKRP
jgi:hypothetical protein